MAGYLFSFQPVWFFCVALCSAILLKKRLPYACYALWLIVLIKFFVPAGVHDLYCFSQIDLSEGYNSFVATLNEADQPVSKHVLPVRPSTVVTPSLPGPKPVEANLNQSEIMKFVFNKLFLNLLLIVVWISGSVFMLIKITTLLVRNRIAKRKWKEIDAGPIYDIFVECCSICKLDFVPELYVSFDDEVASAAYGTKKENAYVSIPKHYFEMSGDPSVDPDDLTYKAVFCHELSHIRNKDSRVDVFRNICKIIFPIHPLRILADKFFNEQREICRDLDAAKLLGISGIKYAQSLARIFLKSDKEISYLAPLDASFFFGDKPLLKRIVFLKKNSKSIDLHKKRSLLFIFPVILLFFINISPLANLFEQDLYISSEYVSRKFPEPEYVYPSNHDAASYPKTHNDLLWVCEEKSGLFAYKFDEYFEPTLVSSHSILPKKELAVDVAFYGDYAYLAVGNADQISFKNSRVDILVTKDNRIEKVGEFPENYPRGLLVVGDHLWLIGSGSYESNGIIALYSLKTPQEPQLIDFFYINFFAKDICHNVNNDQVLISAHNQIIVFKSHDALDIEQEINFDINPGYMEFIDYDQLVVTAYENTGIQEGSADSYLLHCTMDWSRQYQIDNITRLITPSNKQRMSLLHVFDKKLVLTSAGYGLSTLNYNENMYKIDSFVNYNSWFGTQYRDKLIIVYPEIQVFDSQDFGTNDNQVSVWRRL